MITAILQLSSDPLMDKVWGVLIAALVGQAILGALGLIGFVQVSRRFMDREVPAQLATVNASIKEIHVDLEAIGKELIQMRRDVDRHGYQIANLEDWKKEQASRLDDTRGGGGAPRRPR